MQLLTFWSMNDRRWLNQLVNRNPTNLYRTEPRSSQKLYGRMLCKHNKYEIYVVVGIIYNFLFNAMYSNAEQQLLHFNALSMTVKSKLEHFLAHRKCMLLLSSTIAFFHNSTCYSSCTTWRTGGTPRCDAEPEKP